MLVVDVTPADNDRLVIALGDELRQRPHLINPHVFYGEKVGWVLVRLEDEDTRPDRSAAAMCEEVFEATAAVLDRYEEFRVFAAPVRYRGWEIKTELPVWGCSYEMQTRLNHAGQHYGCHTCGWKESGTASGNFIPDVQYPSAVEHADDEQAFYPHCLGCNREQGCDIRAFRLGLDMNMEA